LRRTQPLRLDDRDHEQPLRGRAVAKLRERLESGLIQAADLCASRSPLGDLPQRGGERLDVVRATMGPWVREVLLPAFARIALLLDEEHRDGSDESASLVRSVRSFGGRVLEENDDGT
jgi:hypothetical protein